MRTETELGLSRLVEVELFSALSRRVRMREISQEDAKEITIRFQTHLDNDFYIRIPLETAHYQLARELIGRFDTPLRTLDALHLACTSSKNIRLVTADDALARSAEVLGVRVQLLRARVED
ncbi:type II toxin-antitoxin system VapC family toxin [Pleurocapsales cyanobacterium LEGE 06147]|nr:type II toxin-antitoxin system VapC family toxin [Pleurocapsales cyanobacterium LEGE 06147]